MTMSRRHILGAGALALTTASPARAQTQAPLKLGILGDLSGPYRDLSGLGTMACVRQAIEDLAGAGTSLPVEVLHADHQHKPDVGVAIARRLGLRVISFSINADEGATASKQRVVANLKKARRTDITLGHFNQPQGKTAEGFAKELPKMIRAGRHFGTLSRVLA